MEQRRVLTTIDTVLEILKDYTGGQIPQSAQALKLMFNPRERKAAIVVECDEWAHGLPPIGVKFELRKVFAIGGGE